MNLVGNRFGAEKAKKKVVKKKFLDYLLFSPTNKYYRMWHTIDTILCLASAFFYGYVAAYIDADEISKLKYFTLAMEVMFSISFVSNFFKQFHADGTTELVSDHK